MPRRRRRGGGDCRSIASRSAARSRRIAEGVATLAELRDGELEWTLAAALRAAEATVPPALAEAVAAPTTTQRSPSARRCSRRSCRARRADTRAAARASKAPASSSTSTAFRAAALAIGQRAGLLWCGDLAVALALLDVGKGGRALADSPAALELVAWSVSEEHIAAARAPRRRAERTAVDEQQQAATKPPAGTAKPFLGDDELASELDAWDATFDALHDTGTDLGSDPMAWPEPAAGTAKAQVIAISTVAPSPVVDDVPADVPAVAVSKKWIPASTSADTFDEELPNETDFSEVGVRGGPAALGELLGRPTTAPPPPFEDAEPSADATSIGVPALPDLVDEPRKRC